jgi:hypothetical protein
MHKKNLYPATPDFQLKRKKRERRKKKEVGLVGGLGSLTLPDLVVGSRRLAVGTRWPWVSQTHGLFFSFCFSGRGSQTHGLFCFFFLFFRPWVSQHLAVAVPCRRFAQTPRGDPPRNKSTTGHRDPRLGLAGRGFSFRMIKSQNC